ncbi:hypothetical protein M8C21_011197, partial [Ambrosia artemisiifolia]
YKSRYEGDLVAKCYFAKHKLVWEVLDGGLKNKIEIQWSDIMALKATYPDDGPGCLDVVLSRRPLFFRETNPQPRKHTLWQATADFTGGEASLHRRHYLQCPQGLLGKHFEKLIQSDPRLNFLSQQPEIELESPYFEPRKSVFDEPNETNEYDLSREVRPTMFDLPSIASPSGQSSSFMSELHDPSGIPAEFSRESPSPSSGNLPPTFAKMARPVKGSYGLRGSNAQTALNKRIRIGVKRLCCMSMTGHTNGPLMPDTPNLFMMDTSAIESIRRAGIEGLNDLSHWDQIKVPGIHPSMSMTDLVNHVENRIMEQRTSSNHPLSREEQQSLQILEDISRCLFNDGQFGSTPSDEKSVMSKVNSLCCLLQKDPTTFQDLEPKTDRDGPMPVSGTLEEGGPVTEGTGMSRKDSIADLLLNLPRIESLPQFFYNF